MKIQENWLLFNELGYSCQLSHNGTLFNDSYQHMDTINKTHAHTTFIVYVYCCRVNDKAWPEIEFYIYFFKTFALKEYWTSIIYTLIILFTDNLSFRLPLGMRFIYLPPSTFCIYDGVSTGPLTNEWVVLSIRNELHSILINTIVL